MSDLKSLRKAFKKARAAWREDKSDKDLKKAFKAAKAAFTAAKEEAEGSSGAADSGAPDLKALKKAVKDARAEFKKDKTNKAAKKALKEAKKALAAAEEAAGGADSDASESRVAGKKRSAEEAIGGDEKKGGSSNAAESEANDVLAGLMPKKKARTDGAAGAGAPVDHSANPPNPKCFVGNLSYDIDDDAVRAFFKDCGSLVDIYWLEDRESGKFKGCGFITFETAEQAAQAVQKEGQELLGRPLKINYAKPRPGGDRKKPRRSFGGAAPQLSEKPPGCTTVFVGNLSFDIDDGAMRDFAKDCGDVASIRWLSDRETGNFKGCGFIDFGSTGGVDNFVKLNGQSLMGRPIRIDYAKPRA